MLWIYQHPTAQLKEAAKSLRTSDNAIYFAHHKLQKRQDYGILCPFCFSPARFDHVCEACGVEFDGHSEARVEYSSQSPVHTIQAGRGLGSRLTFEQLQNLARLSISRFEKATLTSAELNKLTNNLASVMKQQGNGKENSLIKSVKSDVWQALKEACPPDSVSDEAASMVEEEIRRFHLTYQLGHTPKGLREAISRIVIRRLEILHPELSGKLSLPERVRKPRKNLSTLVSPKPSILDRAFDNPGFASSILEEGG